jgi:hypothetical protein
MSNRTDGEEPYFGERFVVRLEAGQCTVVDTSSGGEFVIENVVCAWVQDDSWLLTVVRTKGGTLRVHSGLLTDLSTTEDVNSAEEIEGWILAKYYEWPVSKTGYRNVLALARVGQVDRCPIILTDVGLVSWSWSDDRRHLAICDGSNIWTWKPGDEILEILAALSEGGFLRLSKSDVYWSPCSRWILNVSYGHRPVQTLPPAKDPASVEQWIKENPDTCIYGICLLDVEKRRMVTRFVLDHVYDYSWDNGHCRLLSVNIYGQRRVVNRTVSIDCETGTVNVHVPIEFI